MSEEYRKVSLFFDGMFALSVLLGIVCPGLFVMRVFPAIFLVAAFLFLPVVWVVRWKTLGFLAGWIFLSLCSHAIGLESIGPGQVDNMVPAFSTVFGPFCALFYLGPIYLARMLSSRSLSRAAQSKVRRTSFTPRAILVVLVAAIVSIGFLRYSWAIRPRHPQYVAIEAVEARGALVELEYAAPGKPVWTLRCLGRATLGDADAKYIAEFRELRHLDLTGCDISDRGLEALEGLVSLRELNLSSTRVSNEGLISLFNLANLESLALNDTAITDEGMRYLEALPELRTFEVRNTHLTNDGVKHLEKLRHLEFVDLSNTQVTEAAVKALRRTLPKCTVRWRPATANDRQSPAAPDQLR